MATMFYRNGEKTEMSPANGVFFTLKEITEMFKSTVTISFYYDMYLFVRTGIRRVQANKNDALSKMFGQSIYGNVFVAKEFELSPQFFIPGEVRHDVETFLVEKQVTEFGLASSEEESEEPKHEEKVFKNEFKDSTNYTNIIHLFYTSMETFSNSWDKFIPNMLLEIDGRKIKIEPNYKSIDDIVRKSIDVYSRLEEYEKCSLLIRFKNFSEDYLFRKQIETEKI